MRRLLCRLKSCDGMWGMQCNAILFCSLLLLSTLWVICTRHIFLYLYILYNHWVELTTRQDSTQVQRTRTRASHRAFLSFFEAKRRLLVLLTLCEMCLDPCCWFLFLLLSLDRRFVQKNLSYCRKGILMDPRHTQHLFTSSTYILLSNVYFFPNFIHIFTYTHLSFVRSFVSSILFLLLPFSFIPKDYLQYIPIRLWDIGPSFKQVLWLEYTSAEKFHSQCVFRMTLIHA